MSEPTEEPRGLDPQTVAQLDSMRALARKLGTAFTNGKASPERTHELTVSVADLVMALVDSYADALGQIAELTVHVRQIEDELWPD